MTVNRIILTTLLLFLGVFHFASSKTRKCEVIKIPMCKGIGYNLTYMPNMFNQDTQEEAALDVHQFWPLVEIKCSPDLKFFLCSMYAPLCQPNIKRRRVPPCRSICERAREGCAPLMRQYGFSWPERMKCENFPKMGDRLCLNGTTELTTTKTTSEKRCEKIKLTICQSTGYKLTSMPNMFNHSTQEEAALEIHQFWPLVEINCSPELKFFLCSMYVPKCQPNSKDEVLPCRSLCRRARKGCSSSMRQYGFTWPERMRCRTFPKDRGNGLCLNSRLNHTSTTERPTNSSLIPACKEIIDRNLAVTSRVHCGSSKPPLAFTQVMLLAAILAIGQIPV